VHDHRQLARDGDTCLVADRSDRGRPAAARAPARSLVSIEDVGFATAGLATDAARLITGDTIYIDGGYHIMG
jgi:enoyl-[acyl-carrier-protein] reductase (NADH)